MTGEGEAEQPTGRRRKLKKGTYRIGGQVVVLDELLGVVELAVPDDITGGHVAVMRERERKRERERERER